MTEDVYQTSEVMRPGLQTCVTENLSSAASSAVTTWTCSQFIELDVQRLEIPAVSMTRRVTRQDAKCEYLAALPSVGFAGCAVIPSTIRAAVAAGEINGHEISFDGLRCSIQLDAFAGSRIPQVALVGMQVPRGQDDGFVSFGPCPTVGRLQVWLPHMVRRFLGMLSSALTKFFGSRCRASMSEHSATM